MQVKQFRYGADNLGYLIYGKKEAMAIDGGAVDDVLVFLKENELALTYVTNTHNHPDHTQGAQALAQATGAVYLNPGTLIKKKRIEMAEGSILVHHTPGHTNDSITFEIGKYLITGDTLFNGTVGNCFSGDSRGFYRSIIHLLSFDDDTIVYAGHDYVEESMAFARSLEPSNRDIDRFMDHYEKEHVYSTLAQERLINPYLRFNEKTIIRLLRTRGLAVETEFQRWESIMSIG
jgi:hydroxyacylglutathione hydrolase